MSLQLTPPALYASSPELPTNTERTDFVNMRKRKQMDGDDVVVALEKKFEHQLEAFYNKVTQNINNAITEAVNVALTQQISKISSSLENLNTNVQKLSTDNINIRKTLSKVGERLLEAAKSLQYASENKKEFDKRIQAIEDTVSHSSVLQDQILELENKISVMEQQARQCNIEISNLPERRGENLIDILESISNEIKIRIQRSDVISIHRVPHADQKNPRPKNVIVKFTTRVIHNNFVTGCRAI
ncbi:uncharacterized protein LOC123662485 [Melitaea cinxia]|uniref:uncharacterized protein LOC123662485 n=1 Tax=Melitaea cinxia TaxID=113334 RepID=UPI001E26EF85|nr:uncharacterized protein LOC123662485 [Melitaea cinxia]